MKNKNKSYLFIAAFLFLSAFFVRLDGVANVANASCASDCQDMATDGSGLDEGLYGECYATYDCYSVDTAGSTDGGIDTGNNNDSCPYNSNADRDCSCSDLNNDGYCDNVNVGGDTDISFWNGVNSAGNYQNCVGYCQEIGDSGDCYMACGEQYAATGGGGLGSGSDYGCGDGYTEDPKDSTNCIPVCEQRGYQYSYVYDECRGGATASCLIDDECGRGYSCNSSNNCELNTTGKLTGGEFSSGANSGSGKILTATKSNLTLGGITIPLGTSINTATGVATLPNGSAIQLPASDIAAMNNVITAPGGSSSYTVINPGSTSYTVIDPVTGRAVNGTNSINQPKCGTTGAFKEIGGVCFPTNTGLSEAPVITILGKIFAWLMGLFAILAVMAFVVSGIQYLMAAGNESMAETAKRNATYALIGIIIGLSGFIIVQAISAALSGGDYRF